MPIADSIASCAGTGAGVATSWRHQLTPPAGATNVIHTADTCNSEVSLHHQHFGIIFTFGALIIYYGGES